MTAAVLVVTAPADAARVNVGTPTAIAVVNDYRRASGLPAVADYTWRYGGPQRAHARYMLLNQARGGGAVSHREIPGTPGYSRAGSNAASQSIVGWGKQPIAERTAVDNAMASPLHAMALLNPSTSAMAFGEAWDLANRSLKHAWNINTARWKRVAAPRVVLFPGSGATVRLKDGYNEWPAPQDQCGAGYGRGKGGLPVFAMLTRVPTSASASMTGPGGQTVPVCVLHAGNTSGQVRAHLRANKAVLVIPLYGLSNSSYTVSVRSNGGNAKWSFQVNGPKRWNCSGDTVVRCQYE